MNHKDLKKALSFMAATLSTILLSIVFPALGVAQGHRHGETDAISIDGSSSLLPLQSASGEAVASWLYAMDLGTNDGSCTLLRLGATASGGLVDLEVIGETGVEDIFDIAFMGNRLFGIGPGLSSFGTFDDVLVEIDPSTGATTPVGTINAFGSFNALVGESASTLLGATTSGEVWRINPDALTASPIGGFGGSLDSSGDLAFTLDGRLFGITAGFSSDNLAQLSPSTGFASVVGPIGFREVYGLTTNPLDGELLAVVDAEDNPQLARVNQTTGAASVIGRIPTSVGISGLASAPVASGSCTPNATTHCLNNSRFRVQATWTRANGSSGNGRVLSFSPSLDDSGAFWFFSQDNVEMIVKVINGCGRNNRFWFFAGGLTNVRTRIEVEDTQTGARRVYQTQQGQPFQPIQDTAAFATCP